MYLKCRCVHETSSATVELRGQKLSKCRVLLYLTEIKFIAGDNEQRIAIGQISSIEVHQPIFAANYITGSIEGGTFTITFNQGGATEFARAFFRITEGNLVTTEAPPEQPPPEPPSQSRVADKKND